MEEIAAWTGVISLIVAFVSLYRTRKSGEQQRQLDETRTELARHANEIQAIHTAIAQDQLNLNERVIAAQSPAVVKVTIVEKTGKYFFRFQNTGLGEATDVYFQVVGHPTGHIHKPKDHTDGIVFHNLPAGAQEDVPLTTQETRLYHAQLNWSNPDGQDVKKKVDVVLKT